jgi:hypothetical protein
LETKELSAMNSDDIDTSKPLPDDYEWGQEHLKECLKAFPGLSAPDANLLPDIARGASAWQLPPPKWVRVQEGIYELKTPYGLLTVRRMFGWVARLDGAPLVWCIGGQIINFDKLKDAQTSAVLHARDEAVDRFGDGTRWDREKTIQLTCHQSAPISRGAPTG